MGSNTRVLSPSIVTETRFGFTQFYNTTGPQLAFTRDVVGELEIPGLEQRTAGAMGHPERVAVRRLRRIWQRLRGPLREQQQLAPVPE